VKKWQIYLMRIVLLSLGHIALGISIEQVTYAQDQAFVETQQIGTGSFEGEIAVSPDGRTLAAAANRLGVWLYELNTLEPLELLSVEQGEVSAIDWSPDGNYLAFGLTSLDDNNIQIWDVATKQLLSVIEGHNWSVGDVIWSPDGTLLASGGSSDGKTKIWNAETGQLLSVFDVADFGVDSLDWSLDGRYIIYKGYSSGGIIQVWDIQNEQVVFSSTAFTNAVNTVAISPDGVTIAASGTDGTSGNYSYKVRVWNIQTRQELSTIDYTGDAVSLAWSPNGSFLAVLEAGRYEQPQDDERVTIVDSITWQNVSQARGDWGVVKSIEWLPDMSRIVFSSFSGKIRVWDWSENVASSDEQPSSSSVLFEHRDNVQTVTWSPDGVILASGSYDGTVQLWDNLRGEIAAVLDVDGVEVNSISWSPDGTMLASVDANGVIRLWDIASGQEMGSIENNEVSVNSIAWSPDGTKLASGSENGEVTIWDIVSLQQIFRFESVDAEVRSVAWSPESSFLAVANSNGTIQIWNGGTGQTLTELENPGGWVETIDWSSDGLRLASGDSSGKLTVWNIADGRVDASLTVDNILVASVAWSPDDKQIAAAGFDGKIQVWNLETNQQIILVEEGEAVSTIAWSPDGSQLASGGWDGKVYLWNFRLPTPNNQNPALLESVMLGGPLAWSPNGAYLVFASDDDTLRVWDIESNRNLFTLHGFSFYLPSSISWSPDSMYLVSGGTEGVRVWSMETGQQVNAFLSRDDSAKDVAWSPSGEFIAAASFTGIIEIWNVETGQIYTTLLNNDINAINIAWSPDNTHLVVASVGLQVWDITTGQREDLSDNELISVADWSPNSTKLITGGRDGVLRLWDLITREETVLSLEENEQEIYDVSWSPSGTQAAVVSGTRGFGNKISVWTTGENEQLAIRWTHLGIVQTVEWSPDETQLASVGNDGVVRIWSVEE
jgi:WD40 repeat protein